MTDATTALTLTDRHRVWIVEDSDRVVKLDAVLAQVGTLFVGVTLELHDR
jgi:hypothetical protein